MQLFTSENLMLEEYIMALLSTGCEEVISLRLQFLAQHDIGNYFIPN